MGTVASNMIKDAVSLIITGYLNQDLFNLLFNKIRFT
jgi:hypothetical protein